MTRSNSGLLGSRDEQTLTEETLFSKVLRVLERRHLDGQESDFEKRPS